MATFEPIYGARRMPEGGNNLHVSRIFRGWEHARTKLDSGDMYAASCKHVNRGIRSHLAASLAPL